jgi:hypothetical protein
MQFMIFRKPPGTVVLKIGGGVAVPAAEGQRRCQVMF